MLSKTLYFYLSMLKVYKLKLPVKFCLVKNITKTFSC